MELLTLDEYDKLANKLTSIYKRKYKLRNISEEMLGTMVRYMAMADWTYDSSKSDLTQYQFRRQAGIYAIRYCLKGRKTKCFTDCSDDRYDDPNKAYNVITNRIAQEEDYFSEYNIKESPMAQVKFLIDNAGLSDNQKLFIRLRLEGNKSTKVAELSGFTLDEVYRDTHTAIELMQRIVK